MMMALAIPMARPIILIAEYPLLRNKFLNAILKKLVTMRRYFHDERQTVGWMPPMLYQNAICLIRRQLKRHGKFTLLRFRYIGCAFLIQPGDWEGIYSLLFDLRHSPTPCRSFLSGYSSIVCCQRSQPEFSHNNP